MCPLEYIKHEYFGVERGVTMCDDHDCHTSVGPKYLASYHHGYTDKSPATNEEVQSLFTAVKEHNRNHKMRIIIGHAERRINPETGNSVVVYEYPKK